jgi:hypothetical protein
MALHFYKPVPAVSLLLCAGLLAACSAKVTEPVKATPAYHLTQSQPASQSSAYRPSDYGIPEAGNVNFQPDAQKPLQDLTY